MSAAARAMGDSSCPSIAAAFGSLPEICELTNTLLLNHADTDGYTDGVTAGRALLCTALITIGAYASWIGLGANSLLLPRILPFALYSLTVPEGGDGWPLREQWPLLAKQEHAGCVAIMKLCTLAPHSVLCAVGSCESFVATCHAHAAQSLYTAQEPSRHAVPQRQPLTRRSALLLLQAAVAVGGAAAGGGGTATPTSVAELVLGPVLRHLERFVSAVVHAKSANDEQGVFFSLTHTPFFPYVKPHSSYISPLNLSFSPHGVSADLQNLVSSLASLHTVLDQTPQPLREAHARC